MAKELSRCAFCVFHGTNCPSSRDAALEAAKAQILEMLREAIELEEEFGRKIARLTAELSSVSNTADDMKFKSKL